MKKRRSVAVLIFIHFLYFAPLFHPGIFQSHDGEAHVARFAAYTKAFTDWHIPPRWAGNLNAGYGTPVLNFFYPLPGYLGSFLSALGVSFQNSFKILAGLSFLVAPVTFYLWMFAHVSSKAAFAGSLLYGLAPYHFLDLYVRGDIGELFALAIIPLAFWSIDQTKKNFSLRTVALGGVMYGVLILSHNALALMVTPVLVGYIFLTARHDARQILRACSLLVLGLGLASYFWIPAILEQRYTHGDIFIGSMYRNHFPKLEQLLVSPWGLGPDITKSGGLSPQIGMLHFLLALGGFLLLKKRPQNRNFVIFWLITFGASIAIMLPISSIIWEALPLLKKIQFPWRFVAIASFATSTVSTFFLNSTKHKNIPVLVAILLIIVSFSYARVAGFTDHPDSFYETYAGTTDYHGAATTVWSAGNPSKGAPSPAQIISGDATIEERERNTVRHIYRIVAKTQATILDNTFYFPGWQARVNNQKVPIQFQDANHRGLITFQVPQGTHEIAVRFTESPIRFFSNVVSTLSLTVVIFLFFRYRSL